MKQILCVTASLLLCRLAQALTVEKRVSTLLSWSKSEEGARTVLGSCEERRREGAVGVEVVVRCGDNKPLEVSIPIPKDENSLARTLWPASLAAAILLQSQTAEGLTNNKIVLELGCGLGLAGIVASQNAKSCCLTDHDKDVIQMLQDRNIPHIDARYLEWRDEDRPSDIPASDLVIGADIAYYFYLLRPLMDTAKALLKPENSAFMVVGQANRESQWDLYHNIRDGCYNQLTDEKEIAWIGDTRMLLFQLELSKWHVEEESSSDSLEMDGMLPIAVMLHTSPGFNDLSFTSFDHVATKQDEEAMMMSF